MNKRCTFSDDSSWIVKCENIVIYIYINLMLSHPLKEENTEEEAVAQSERSLALKSQKLNTSESMVTTEVVS